MNPTLKTFITTLAALILPGLDAAMQTTFQPTGGFAGALNSNSAYAMLYGAGLITVHNIITTWEAKAGIHPTQQTLPASPPSKPQ